MADERGRRRGSKDRDELDGGRRSALLGQVEVALRLRLADPSIEITAHEAEPPPGYLVACLHEGPFFRPAVVGAHAGTPTVESIDRFLAHACARDHLSSRPPELVYEGGPPSADVEAHASGNNVWLRSLTTYQRVWNPDRYVASQRARLADDGDYLLDRYVDKPWAPLGQPDPWGDDVADEIVRSLDTPGPRFLLALGDFGTGKTFLLRYLAATLPDRLPHLTPVLITMRELQKARSLHELVSQHMARHGEDPFHFAAFQHLLRLGRIALLVDGFDELALRLDYAGAAAHFATLRAAADGNAKVVITSRYAQFANDKAVLTTLGAEAERVAGARIIKVLPLGPEQKAAVASTELGGDDDRARHYLDLLGDVPDLLGLAENTRLLTFMIRFIPEADLKEAARAGERHSAASLYRMLVERWLRYETERQSPPGGTRVLSEDQRRSAVRAAARAMWQAGTDRVSLHELGPIAAGIEGLEALGLTKGEATHAVGSATLLRRVGDEEFGFVHQSVMEWLVADHLAELLAGGGWRVAGTTMLATTPWSLGQSCRRSRSTSCSTSPAVPHWSSGLRPS